MWMMSKQLGIVPKSCRAALGPLEAEIMKILWCRGECNVRQVVEQLPRKMAYTTVMTTLVRLVGKELADRRQSRHRFLYSARFTEKDWQELAAREAVARFLGTPNTSRELLVSHLLEALCQDEAGLLARVKLKIQEKRRELNIARDDDGSTEAMHC